MRYELIIFDNDGVLVDSEAISNRILATYLTELGHPTSYEDSIRDFMGAAMHRIHEMVMERSGLQLPQDFDAVFHARVFEAFRQELEPVNGVAAVLEKLAALGVPYCVASSSKHERIRVSLRETGIFPYFQEKHLFSAQDVARGKPSPDLFLHAAAVLGVPAERCAVIEDSPLGVRAAIAAGMDVYGYVAMTPRAKLLAANALFSNMEDLLDLLS